MSGSGHTRGVRLDVGHHAPLTPLPARDDASERAPPALVETNVGGEPRLVDRELVVAVREEWRVVDRWWTDEPVDRRYFEVVLESGRNVCVYRDGERRCWFTQRA